MLASLASHQPPGSRLMPEQPARKPQLARQETCIDLDRPSRPRRQFIVIRSETLGHLERLCSVRPYLT
jgi:hypothetical protein